MLGPFTAPCLADKLGAPKYESTFQDRVGSTMDTRARIRSCGLPDTFDTTT